MESKQSMPSVVARLMGLDEQQPQQPLQKKPRVLSEDYLYRVASVGVRGKWSGRHSFRLSTEEQEKSNVVFQVLETLKRSKCHSNSFKKRGAHLSLLEAKATSIRKKCVEEDLTVNKKLLNAKHPDLQEPRFHSLLDGITVLNPLYASDCKDKSRRRKSWRENEEECTDSLKKFQNGFGTYSSGEHCFDDVKKFLDSQVESKDGLSCPTSRIVVLKPTLRKVERSSSCLEAFHLGNGTSNEILYVEGKGRRNLVVGTGTVRLRSRFSNERTIKTVHDISNISREVPRSEIISSDSFNKKSQSISHSLFTFSDRKDQFSSSDGSNVAKEAKKQIVERWKTTKKFQEVDLATRNRTLGEMFAIPDDDLRPTNLDCNADNGVLNKHVGPDTGYLNDRTPSGRGSPGWKDGRVRGLLRSRSIIENFDAVESPNVGTKNESKDGDISEQDSVVQMAADMVFDTKTEVMTGLYFNHVWQQLESKNWIFPVKDEDSSPYLLDGLVQQDIFSGISADVSMPCKGMDPESPSSLEEAYQPSPDSVLEELNKKEISSSTHFFKRVGDSLHGLHVQLELLKSETSKGSGIVVSSDEDSGDESVDDSKQNEELPKMFRVAESRHFSYLVDILTEAGFRGKNLYMGITTWNPQECPISYSVFETLEKKYGEQLSWDSSERRLLFDLVNSGLVEILETSVAVPMLIKPVARRFSFSQGLRGIEEELWTLLVNQEKEASMESGKVLGNDGVWMEMGDDIQAIGREIEKSLIDELMEDAVSLESF